MSKLYTHEDSLRAHDVAVYNWLRTLLIDYGTIAGVARNGFPILALHATPDRPFALIPDLLVSMGWISGTTADEMRTNAEDKWPVRPLPICTLYRLDPLPDPELAGAPKQIRSRWLNQATGQWESHPWPGHYRTEYTLTFWSLKKYTDAHIREWVYSNFGKIGAGNAEMFLPVTHDAPWGVMNQSFKLVGSSDLSELEGDQPRYIRTEFQFSLRTWIMHKTTSSAPVVDRVGSEVPDAATETWGNVGQSGNLFFIPTPALYVPSSWPRTGAAKVALNVDDSMHLTVGSTLDSVELLERPITLGGAGLATVSTAFTYRSTAGAYLEVGQRDPTTGVVTTAFELLLPAAPAGKKVHVFTVVQKPIFNVSIVGAGTAAVVDVSEIDIRHLNDQWLSSPDERVDAGTHWHYRWNTLVSQPYLVVAQIVSTPGPVTFQVDDDATAPAFTRSQVLDSTVNVGAVFLAQPKASSLVVKAPKTVALASLSLHRYGSAYHGHEV